MGRRVVEALCDPPESFSFGGMVAHVLTFSAYRRQQLLNALQRHGIDDLDRATPSSGNALRL